MPSPAPFEADPARVAVESRLVVVNEHGADQRVGPLQRRLRAAQDLHRSDVEERRLQVVARLRAESGLVEQHGSERVGGGERPGEARVVDAADAVGPEPRRARERVGGPVEGVLDGEDGVGLEPLGAQIGHARPELLPAGVELAADDGHVLGEAGELQLRVQRDAVRIRHHDPVPAGRLEAGEREGDRVVASRQATDGVASSAVGDRHSRSVRERRAGGLDGHARQDAAGLVGYRAGDDRMLCKRRQRQGQQAGDDGGSRLRHDVALSLRTSRRGLPLEGGSPSVVTRALCARPWWTGA